MMRIMSSAVVSAIFISQIFFFTTLLYGMEMPQQGTIIPCEECVVLYPEKYKNDPKKCPVCYGKKEHFQPARMMDAQLIDIEAKYLEQKIESFLFDSVMNTYKQPVSKDVLVKMRKLYKEKLIFHLIYGKFEREMIKTKILELDAQIKNNTLEP